ncbi:MAG: ABC transporter ATP-binding protein [Elusimicrobia bacterium]|nr:ABC transporter ATP-binding protein [Elusimicrobiota bacterium]
MSKPRRRLTAAALAALLFAESAALEPSPVLARTVAARPAAGPGAQALPWTGPLRLAPDGLASHLDVPRLGAAPLWSPVPSPQALGPASVVPQALPAPAAPPGAAPVMAQAFAALPAPEVRPASSEESVRQASLAFDGEPGERGAVQASEGMEAAAPQALGPSAPRRGGLRLLREMAFGQKEFEFFLKPHQRQMNTARGLLIAKAVLNTALSYSVGALVDAALAHALPAAGLWLGVLTGVLALKAVQQKFYNLSVGTLRTRLRREFRLRLFRAILDLPPGERGQEDPHELAARLTRDAGNVTVKNVTIPVQFPHLVIQLGLAAGFVVATSWKLALAALAAIPVLAYLSWRYGQKISQLQEQSATRQARMTRAAAELLSRSEELRSPGEREQAADEYRRSVKKNELTILDIVRLNSTFESIFDFLQACFAEVLVLGLGLGSFILTGTPSVGQVMSLRGYAKDLRGAVDGVLGLYTDGKDAEGATRRVLDLLRRGRPAAD